MRFYGKIGIVVQQGLRHLLPSNTTFFDHILNNVVSVIAQKAKVSFT